MCVSSLGTRIFPKNYLKSKNFNTNAILWGQNYRFRVFERLPINPSGLESSRNERREEAETSRRLVFPVVYAFETVTTERGKKPRLRKRLWKVLRTGDSGERKGKRRWSSPREGCQSGVRSERKTGRRKIWTRHDEKGRSCPVDTGGGLMRDNKLHLSSQWPTP